MTPGIFRTRTLPIRTRAADPTFRRPALPLGPSASAQTPSAACGRRRGTVRCRALAFRPNNFARCLRWPVWACWLGRACAGGMIWSAPAPDCRRWRFYRRPAQRNPARPARPRKWGGWKDWPGYCCRPATGSWSETAFPDFCSRRCPAGIRLAPAYTFQILGSVASRCSCGPDLRLA